MESDLQTSAARLRAGLNNLSASPRDPEARCPNGTRASQPRPLGALLAGHPGGDQPGPESNPPRPERPRAWGGYRRCYVLRRKLEPSTCWPHQYARLPRRAWDDPRLHQGA